VNAKDASRKTAVIANKPKSLIIPQIDFEKVALEEVYPDASLFCNVLRQ
jgi:hypothetical protein